PLQGGFAILRRFYAVEQRMTDEAHPIARGCEDLLFEGKHHGKPVGALADLSDPSAPPCPNLRGDVVEHAGARPASHASKDQVELRVVDQDHEVRAAVP